MVNQSVTLSACAVAHGSLSVTINSTPVVSQPAPFSKGETVSRDKADITIKQEPGSLIQLPAGTKLADVTTVVSHPNPLGQCRVWMAKNLPDATTVAANSTAEAALQVARAKRKGMASIGTPQGAKHASLRIIAREIEDHPENLTRFVIVGHGIPPSSGHDRTTIVCFQRQDKPGSLLAILQEFAARAINLTKLESRPAKRSLGDYCFFIDFEGHLDDEIVADCLRNLRAKQKQVKLLGSYPVAGSESGTRRASTAKAYRDAERWMTTMRALIREDGE